MHTVCVACQGEFIEKVGVYTHFSNLVIVSFLK